MCIKHLTRSHSDHNSSTRGAGRSLASRFPICRASAAWSRHAFTLVELIVVLTVMGVLLSIAAPTVHRSMEQSQADIAAANLRAIWSAQKLYWLDNRTYTNDLSELETLGLLDPAIPSASTWYVYSIPASTDDTFTAAADRTGSVRWTGQLTIDETGVVSGSISAPGNAPVVPGFQ